MAKKPVAVDFETEAINDEFYEPPKPVGVSIYAPGSKPKYLAWGHPTQNNTTFEAAKRELTDLWRSDAELLFQSAPFDVGVAQKWMGLAVPDWRRIHDSLYLLFLNDPHARSLSLKPSAERLLGMPPEEADAVRAWLVKAGIVKASDKKWGRYICKAPGKLVGEYAIGDTVRTRRLLDYLLPKLSTEEREAYDRERQLMPILLRNESEGMRVDLPKLRADVTDYTEERERCADWVRQMLGTPGLNLDSNDDLARALDVAGVVTEWDYTPTGKKSTAKKTMVASRFNNPDIFRAVSYHSKLGTCLSTFMEPWLATAERTNGYIYTRWNQVKQADGGGGTRTGRLSCSPNFQNIPKDWYDKGDGYDHPNDALRMLPMIRDYVLPDKGQLFLHRDYNQQELRILAHFEDDKLCSAYRVDPRLDMHTFVQQEIRNISGLALERRPVKILNFGLMYGMGLGKLAEATGLDIDMAGRIKRAQRAAIPGIAALERAIRQRSAAGEPIVTWGGRRYMVEEPKVIAGVLRTFEYKLLNYLIQGSAADCTKQAVINYDTIRKHGRFMVTVHDEINLSCPPKAAKAEMKLLAEAMESVKFDVPMLSDGKIGKSWGSLEKE